jgi:hypothetical protein
VGGWSGSRVEGKTFCFTKTKSLGWMGGRIGGRRERVRGGYGFMKLMK